MNENNMKYKGYKIQDIILNVLKALGISAVLTEHDDTVMSKKEFINKIDKARKSPKVKVSTSEQSKLLGR